MKPRPFSITGKFVEKLKATKQDSAEEKIARVIQNMFQNIFKRIGRDFLQNKSMPLEKIYYTKEIFYWNMVLPNKDLQITHQELANIH